MMEQDLRCFLHSCVKLEKENEKMSDKNLHYRVLYIVYYSFLNQYVFLQ